MNRIFFYLTILALFLSSCVCRYNLKKNLPVDTAGLGIFIVDNNWKGKSYIAITSSQIDFLTTDVILKNHKGINSSAPLQTVYIVKNHVVLEKVSQRISTNANKFPDSLFVLERKTKSLEKLVLIEFMDSLDRNSIPFFLNHDTLPFYNQVYLNIEYEMEMRANGAVRSSGKKNKLGEKILSSVRELFHDRLIFQQGSSSADGKASVSVYVPINSEVEIPPDLELRLKEKFSSITKVSIGKMEPISYKINYFINSTAATSQ